MKLTDFKGYGEIITASILWGFIGILAKKIVGMQAQSIIFYRVAFAFMILFTVLLITGNLDKIKLKNKKIHLLLFGMLQVMTMVTYFIAILNASVSVAVLLLYTAPVYVTLLSPVFLKESFSTKGVIALILSITGISLIVNLENIEFFQYPIGIIAGILSGIFYAFQIMTSKYISTTYSGYSQAFWSFALAMLLLLPAGFVPLEIVSGNIIYLILLAIFPTLFAISLYFNGLKKVRASSASILALIEPLSAVILAVLILSEKISVPLLLGGALILAGAALVTKDE
ncbi:MAG: DMT family transporter [Candidatus Methanoperedens sp.]|nr:DMT family transporter [Candidatus Methanoperedens sp.]HLB70149.1 DMT family transporter [Candidatus Methanoperedens sp.]